MTELIPYDPGSLPNKKAPSPGEEIFIHLGGLPPAKKRGASLRNPTHPRYASFVALRKAAREAMNGRAWYFGDIGIELTIYGPNDIGASELTVFLGGVMDTLDGSSGRCFTYLPIVYEDDFQVSDARTRSKVADEFKYELIIRFL